MAIRSFQMDRYRGVELAAADDLPNFVVVAGPNGSGKSTLLHWLYEQRSSLPEEGTIVRYLGPHRSWRKTQLATSSMSEFAPTYRQYLEQPSAPQWKQYQPQGFQFVATGMERHHGGLDDSFAFVKASIARLEIRQRALLAEVWKEQDGTVNQGDVPDLIDPLRRLTRLLLPHLELVEVNASDDSNLRVLFRRVDPGTDVLVELDDLSSGEKSVVSLMLPFVEDEADALEGIEEQAGPIPTFILDEPETHLHPSLQVLLVEHLERLAYEGRCQVIIATQSPTIVDSLSEFYLLVPPASASGGNQLLQITSADGKLEAMRGLTGSTHLLTRCRPIVFLEGERPETRSISDQRIVETLLPEASGWVLVAAQGRGQVSRAAAQLRDAMRDEMPEIPVFAIVDRDQAQHEDPEFVISWGVAMIENLLLDAEAIWTVLAPLRERVGLNSAADVERELRDIARHRREDEIRLRIPSIQKPFCVRVKASEAEKVTEGISDAKVEIDRQLNDLDEAGVKAEFEDAQAFVDQAITEGRELEVFRGKEVFKAFFESHGKHTGDSFLGFTMHVARECSKSERTSSLVDAAVRRVEEFVPESGLNAIDAALSEAEIETVRGQVEAARESTIRAIEASKDPTLESVDLEALRSTWLQLANQIASVDAEIASRLRRSSSMIGMRSAVKSLAA